MHKTFQCEHCDSKSSDQAGDCCGVTRKEVCEDCSPTEKSNKIDKSAHNHEHEKACAACMSLEK